ncbi:MAG: TlpA family protein disulfide reductase [Phycisphaerales bacterium]|nr:TlpA family protein disulfide reductase [Phycisphaerales bacterium]
MTRNRWILPWTALLLTAGAAFAQPTEAALKVLRAADDATKAVQALSYSARHEGFGVRALTDPVVVGSVTLARNPSFEAYPAKVRYQGSAWNPTSPTPLVFASAFDGETAYLINHEGKLFVSGDGTGQGLRLLYVGDRMLLTEFASAEPFKDEIEAKVADLEGRAFVNGVLCNVVYVEYRDDPETSKARWYFGAEDSLPRRVERLTEINGRSGATVVSLSELRVLDEAEESLFRLEAPEGFETRRIEPRQTARPPAPELHAVGTSAPDWTLKDAAGNTHSLADYRGKVVLLDFWATWCGPCKQAMPSIQRLHERFAGRPVAVFGLSCFERPGADPAGYMAESNFTYGLLLDGTDVAMAYNVAAIPTFYLIGFDGTIIHRETGYTPKKEAELAKVIEDYLQSQGK